jgi:hypothetical protein
LAICVKSSSVSNAGCASWNGNDWGRFGVDSAVGVTYSRDGTPSPGPTGIDVFAAGRGPTGDAELDVSWDSRSGESNDDYGKVALMMETHKAGWPIKIRRGVFGYLAIDPLHGNLWSTDLQGTRDRITFSHPSHGGTHTSVQGRRFNFRAFDRYEAEGSVHNCGGFSTDLHGWGGLNDSVFHDMLCD